MKDEGQAQAFRSAAEAVDWITGLMPVIGIRPGLERMTLLMERFGNPHLRLKFIHVAGTNGKGSVCAYLTHALRQCGYDVGTFTSPYLTSYSNRLQYNERDIPEDTLLQLANRIKPEADALAGTEWGPPTMFEVTTALALLYYGTVAYPDYVVWETGMGGRLDVTNIVTPVVSVITNVGHDHMDMLGPTLADIAREKAGIIKPGVPVVTTELNPETLAIFREKAKSCRSTMYSLGEHFHCETVSAAEDEQTFAFSGPFRDIPSLTISLNGIHQQKNAAAAVMTLEVLRQYYALIVEDGDLAEGLRKAAWPGRLEMVSREPRILLDGAHNPEGMEALAAALRDIYRFDRLNVMIAMMPNKNHEHSLRHILPMVDLLVITEPDFHKKMKADDLADVARRLRGNTGRPAEIVAEPDWRKALSLLTGTEDASSPGTLHVVTGTLYLIADVRSWLLHGTKSEKGW
ncbi:bifunctional folylpolyglutamate synthase/dihydrofolate synthase [Cohnella sp. CFH 77786]|uniref:bifunctional folylpolyglutamate synthase/dihydrofolate synthase n=1 Tax=Cohnella sp. CFH 77786 TaxID=2662265 RepID=UPI001C60BD1E|nr:folylpolyglutamate synthase/dihydrofolate synthase family protein [Cohnella sp. CFH 77786]MBW5447853.1 bifunctional folylpolyglutamate synthase/dihydrofolate synthase [Cohnella sp. CFH 77786]